MNEIGLDSPSSFSLANDSAKWPGIDQIRSACLGWILFNIETICSAGGHLLTPREAVRAMRMGSRRRRDFIAARVALKRLARQLDIVKENRPDREIETLGPDDVRPCLAESGIYCSVSHSARLVAAVAHRHPVGVDIEMVSEKATRTKHLFMTPRERALVFQSGLSRERAATRAWTIKEAAAKALGLPLFQAIQEVKVIRVGEKEGVMSYQKRIYPVIHAEGDGYVMSLICCDDD